MACGKSDLARLDKRVTLQAVTRFEDGQGGFLETWTDVATLWAGVTPLKGYERMQAMQLASPTTHKILIRYRKGLTPANRLLYGFRVLEIKEAIDIDERHAWMQLICVEGETLAMEDPDWDRAGLPWERMTDPWGIGLGMDVPWGSLNSPWGGASEAWNSAGGMQDIARDWNTLNSNWESLG